MADDLKSERQEKELSNLKRSGRLSKIRETRKGIIKFEKKNELMEVENSETFNLAMEKEYCKDELETEQTKAPESGQQQVPEILGCEASDGQTTDRYEKEEVSKVREKAKSETAGTEFPNMHNEEPTEVEDVETLNVPIEKQPGTNTQDQQQIEAPESGMQEVLEISACEASDGQKTVASDVGKTAKEDDKIPEIRIEDFCDSPEAEAGSQGDEGNMEQSLQEDQVFRDLCKMLLAGS